MAITEAQKKYEKKRAKLYKNMSARYKVTDIELVRLEKYLQDNNLSASGYIQELVKRDLDEKGIAKKHCTTLVICITCISCLFTHILL